MRFTNPWKSVRLKMSFLAAIILGSILILYSFYLFVQIQNVLSQNVDAELKVKALELAKTIKAFQDTKSPQGDIHYAAIKVLNFDIDLQKDRDLNLADRQWFRLIDRYDLNEDYVSIISLKGKNLASTQDTPSSVQKKLDEMFMPKPHVKPVWGTISYDRKDLRVIQITILARDKPHYYIQIATPLITVNQFLQGRLWAIAISILVVVILFGFVGLLLANQILRPVYKIAETAEGMTHEDLSHRVKISEIDNEMLVLVNAFNQMIERLETSFKHMAGMTAQMAHELKTPLAIIKGEGQLALRKNHSPEKLKGIIQSSIKETERMLRVIDDLLTAANIAYDKEIFNLEKIDLSQFLTDIRQKSQILSEVKDINIKLKLPNKNIFIKGDRVHLRRLFFNLIDNAIKHSPQGSLVNIYTTLKKNKVLISIQDQGYGIAKEDLPHIFERTFKKKKANKNKGKYSGGSGLGLYLCKTIAEAHRGEIQAKNNPGKGATFTLSLPVIT